MMFKWAEQSAAALLKRSRMALNRFIVVRDLIDFEEERPLMPPFFDFTAGCPELPEAYHNLITQGMRRNVSRHHVRTRSHFHDCSQEITFSEPSRPCVRTICNNFYVTSRHVDLRTLIKSLLIDFRSVPSLIIQVLLCVLNGLTSICYDGFRTKRTSAGVGFVFVSRTGTAAWMWLPHQAIYGYWEPYCGLGVCFRRSHAESIPARPLPLTEFGSRANLSTLFRLA